jgi:hypothetical protein
MILAVVWLASFEPAEKLAPSETRAIVGRAGTITVFTPEDGSPAPTGDVTLVEPLFGMNIVATIDHNHVTLPLFAIDRREYAGTVLVLPAATTVRFVTPSAADGTAIRAALLKDDALSGVRRAVAGVEIGAVDVDGDGKADLALTYGCTVWGDGQCQVHGQNAFARVKGSWRELK